jgi:hypothetical protein
MGPSPADYAGFAPSLPVSKRRQNVNLALESEGYSSRGRVSKLTVAVRKFVSLDIAQHDAVSLYNGRIVGRH